MLLISILVFLFIVCSAPAVYWLLFRPPSAANQRLEDLRTPSDAVKPSRRKVVSEKLAERVAEPLNRLAPPSPENARKLQIKLIHAGYLSPQASIIYRALQLLCLVAFPALTVLALTTAGYLLTDSTPWIIGGILVGYVLPRSTLDHLINSRQQRLRWGLADALDLLVVSVEAGLGLNSAMVRVSDELKDVHPDISREFGLVNLEIRVGREREEALRNLANRTGVDDLRGLCTMMIQADRFGTSVTRSIRIYADSLRTKRRQRAEQAAHKAAVKLLLPLALFLFPTLFIAVLGPAFIQLLDSFINP